MLTIKEKRKKLWNWLDKLVPVRCDCGLYIMVNPKNPSEELKKHFKKCELIKSRKN